eukprot:c56007_g1_i1.p1 GENE.c56007_g1_i1~~c56007_g1_i1.p1  ORF type:complete len:240 (+),score=35.80 c56007_g1_i1:123-842(+)
MLRATCWWLCCCGCRDTFRRPVTEEQRILEDAVNRSDIATVIAVLRHGAEQVDLEAPLEFSSDFMLEPVPRGALQGKLRYMHSTSDGWKYIEVVDSAKGSYLHLSSVALRMRTVPRAHRDWNFAEHLVLLRGTLLHLAILRGSLQVVQMLLLHGASREADGKWLFTGFVESAARGAYALTEIGRGTAIDFANYEPCTNASPGAKLGTPMAIMLDTFESAQSVMPAGKGDGDYDGDDPSR